MGLRANPGFPPFSKPIGENVSSATPAVTSPVHHIITTAEITTITPPVPDGLGFVGPVYFVADSVFSWTTSGNISAAPGTTLLAGQAYGFIYDKVLGKWYPLAPNY